MSTVQEKTVKILRERGYLAELGDYGFSVRVAHERAGKRCGISSPDPYLNPKAWWDRSPEEIADELTTALETWEGWPEK